MIPARLPDDETARLAALLGFEILDTAPEAAFDDLSALASEICETPIALVSLVDANRQWFKSRVGLDAPETPREIAFCSHAILGGEIFEITDAAEDERFHDNPLVTGAPDIRFYAGKPLVTSQGSALGTLCVIDRVPRRLTALQRRALETLARQVVAQIELRAAARQALALNVAKSRFLAGISHELRTPLNAILGFSRLLKKRSPDPRSADFAERINSSGTRLLNLINDILDLSKAEAGKIAVRREPVDLAQLCRSVVEELSIVAEEGVSLQLDCPEGLGTVDADADRLRQVLVNLVGNALKFTCQGSVIVRVHAGPDAKPTRLEVVDSGVGIAAEQVELIFQPFEQLENALPEGHKGTGLGLALSRRLCEQMGFELGVESEPDKGSRFFVEF